MSILESPLTTGVLLATLTIVAILIRRMVRSFNKLDRDNN